MATGGSTQAVEAGPHAIVIRRQPRLTLESVSAAFDVVVAEFLTPSDLVRMSCGSRYYRGLCLSSTTGLALSKTTEAERTGDPAATRSPEALRSLLGGMRRLGVLKMADPSHMGALCDALMGGSGQRIRELEIGEQIIGATVDLEPLARAIEMGALPGLQSLRLGKVGSAAVVALARVLSAGALRLLVELRLEGRSSEAGWGALASALEARLHMGLHGLHTLNVMYNSPGATDVLQPETLGRLVRAAGGGAGTLQSLTLFSFKLELGPAVQAVAADCRALTSLMLMGRVGDGSLSVLASAVQAGSMQALREFGLKFPGGHGLKFRALMEAIASGHGCPALEAISISGSTIAGACGSVAMALSVGAFPVLRALDFRMTSVSDQEVQVLAHALVSNKQASGSLRELVLSNCSFGAEGARALAEAFGSGACPNLETLQLDGTKIQDIGVETVFGAMLGGWGMELQTLGLTRTGMRGASSGAMGMAFQRGACPKLKDFQFSIEEGAAQTCNFRAEFKVDPAHASGLVHMGRLAHAASTAWVRVLGEVLEEPDAAMLDIFDMWGGDEAATTEALAAVAEALCGKAGQWLRVISVWTEHVAGMDPIVEMLEREEMPCPRLRGVIRGISRAEEEPIIERINTQVERRKRWRGGQT